MTFELVHFRVQHDLDTRIWIPHMSAITWRSSLLQLLLLRKSHTNSIPYPFVELGWWHHSIPKHQSGKSTVRSVCIIHLYKTIQGVPFKLYTVLNLLMCCKSLQVHEEALQRERHLFRSCRHKCLNPRLLMLLTHDIQCPNSALCGSTSMSK